MIPLLPLLLASVNRRTLEDIADVIEREAYRLRPPPVIPPPPPPTGPTCSDCGDVLRVVDQGCLPADPAPLCWYCSKTAPGRTRMAAKRLRRLKRAGVYP